MFFVYVWIGVHRTYEDGSFYLIMFINMYGNKLILTVIYYHKHVDFNCVVWSLYQRYQWRERIESVQNNAYIKECLTQEKYGIDNTQSIPNLWDTVIIFILWWHSDRASLYTCTFSTRHLYTALPTYFTVHLSTLASSGISIQHLQFVSLFIFLHLAFSVWLRTVVIMHLLLSLVVYVLSLKTLLLSMLTALYLVISDLELCHRALSLQFGVLLHLEFL